ncbi:MAG: hypothetical protein Q8R92_17105 [Deltaproteobacteria bacterium]|nr:hypothetical protein [Deltaproteobacteria bacterium]
MNPHRPIHAFQGAILGLAFMVIPGTFAGAAWASPASSALTAAAAPPAGYVADFVSTTATGVAMNDAGDVAGTSYTDTGCGPYCLPPRDTVVWRGGERIVLPSVPGLPGIYVRGINAQGWVAGIAGFPGTTTHAVVWKPNGAGYDAIDLGTLSGTTSSDAAGIDDQGRVVGWSSTGGAIPTAAAPFMWSEATGIVDLSAEGFPDEPPIAISPGGAVATPGTWYRLGDPASVVPMPASPPGFFSASTYPTAINDTGDQARFLVSTSTQNLAYLFRFHHDGTWQLLSGIPTGHLATFGVGSITDMGDVTATVGGSAMIAYGPDGLAQSLAALMSPAYQGAGATYGGPMNGAGQILTQVFVGRSPRLVRLTPGEACTTGCIRVNNLQMWGRFISDRKNPRSCTPDAKNRVTVRLELVDEAGQPLRRVRVNGRFLDDYWMDAPVSGMTNRRGVVWFKNEGLACVGAVAFLVNDATQGSRVLDRTTGVVTGYVIPLP